MHPAIPMAEIVLELRPPTMIAPTSSTRPGCYVRVFTTAEKANRDLARWKARRKGHSLYAGVLKRKVL